MDADCVIAAIDGSNEFTCHGRASVSVVRFVYYASALFCGRLYSLLLACIHCDNGRYVQSSCDLSFGVFVLELEVFVHLCIQYIRSCNNNNVVYVHLSFFYSQRQSVWILRRNFILSCLQTFRLATKAHRS